MWQHDRIVSGWSDLLRELHVLHQTEPKERYLNNEDRPDITAFNINSGVNFDFDIAMAHPFSKDIVKRSSEETGHAAEKREQKKIFKYQNQITLTGGAPKFVPLVFEHFGNWGNEADKFLNDLSKKSVDAEGRANEHAFRNRWRRHFSILLQKCNSSVILKKVTRLSCGRVVDSFDNDIHHCLN